MLSTLNRVLLAIIQALDYFFSHIDPIPNNIFFFDLFFVHFVIRIVPFTTEFIKVSAGFDQ